MNKIAEYFCRKAGLGWFCADKTEDTTPIQLKVVKESEDASSYIPPGTSMINRMINAESVKLTLQTFAPFIDQEVRQNGCLSSQTRECLKSINPDSLRLFNKRIYCPIDLLTGKDVAPIKVDKFY